MNTVSRLGSSSVAVSITKTRLLMPICVAARPQPGAAYIVSAMSSTSAWISGVTSVTGSAFSRRRGSG